MFRRIAEMRPPEIPPIYTATSTFIPSEGGMLNVRGRNRATAIDALRPGIDPKIIPTATPAIMRSNDVGSHTLRAAAPNCDKAPIMSTSYYSVKIPDGSTILKPYLNRKNTTNTNTTSIIA